MKLVSVFLVLVLCFISTACSCLLAQDVNANGEGPVLVVDTAQVFSEEQIETLQAKAMDLFTFQQQPVVIFTARKSEHEDVSDVAYDARRYIDENWPPIRKRTFDEITSGKPGEQVGPIRKRMRSMRLLIFAYAATSNEALVDVGSKADPDDHERKHLIKSYVEPKMETAGFYDAAILGLKALKAHHTDEPMPSRPSTFKSRVLLIGGVLVTLLVLWAAIFGTGESGPMYYLGYFFTILGGIFGSATFLWGVFGRPMFLSGVNDRHYGTGDKDAMADLKGTFKG